MLFSNLRRAAVVALGLFCAVGVFTRADLAWSQSESDLQSETKAVWERAQALIGEAKFAEATELLSAHQAKLDAQVGASHPLATTNQQMLGIATQAAGAASDPQAPPPARAQEGGKRTVHLPPEDLARAQAALARGKEARAMLKAGKIREGVEQLDEALGVLELTLGPDDEITATNRELVIAVFGQLGLADRVAQTEARAEQARRTYRPPAPAITPEVEATMKILVAAMEAFKSHDFATALRLFEEAYPVVEKTIAGNAASLVNLASVHGSLYDYALEYDKGEVMHKKALAAIEQVGGSEGEQVITFVESLVTHYMRRGEPAKALPYAERSVKLNERHYNGSLEHADALRSLGDLRVLTGDIQGGIQELGRSMNVVRAQTPVDPKRIILLTTSFARATELGGDGAAALELKAQACELAQASGDPNVALAGRDGCIEVAWEKQDLNQAEALLKESIRDAEIQYKNPRSVFWPSLAHNLALVRYARGDKQGGLALAQEVAAADEARMQREIATGTEAQKRTIFESYQSKLNDILSMGADGSGGEQGVVLALETLLRRKGRALDAASDTARALRYLTTPEQQALLAQQTRLRSLMAGLVLRGGGNKLAPEAVSEALAKLEAEEHEVTADLVRQSAEYRVLTQPVTLSAVQAQIPEDSALIEYVAFLRRDPARLFRPIDKRYYAFILRRSGSPQVVDLGDALAIDRAGGALRRVITERKDVKAKARALHALVMAPVQAKLGAGVKRLLVSPDDELNLVPFAAIQEPTGQFLIERYEINYLTSGRDLLRLAALRNARSPAVAVGNPAFDTAPAAEDASGQRSADLARARFSPLPGTAEEVSAIAQILDNPTQLTGAEATKARLLQLDGPLVLHVATHGFFLDEQSRSSKNSRSLELDLGESALPPRQETRENPLLRSGLAFAGANDKTNASGILTALEASSINLDGTRLVVLSACETGIGEVEMGDGVYGLRRALLVAGSESQVMSLWKVDDTATKDLMIGFYEALRDGEERGAALRKVQLEMLRSKGTEHPYFWAAFIPSGNWGKMDFVVKAPQGSGSEGGSNWGSGGYEGPILTGDGARSAFHLRRMNITNLLNQPDRTAWTLGYGLEIPLLSGDKEGEIGLAFHDAARIEGELGLRTGEDAQFAGEPEGNFAFGYFLAYEAAVGYRGGSAGLLVGLRAGLHGIAIGDVLTGGAVMPWFVSLELPDGTDSMFAFSGWYGKVMFDHETLGARIDYADSDDFFFRASVDQAKLSTSVRDLATDQRTSAGRQVTTSYTLSIGAHL